MKFSLSYKASKAKRTFKRMGKARHGLKFWYQKFSGSKTVRIALCSVIIALGIGYSVVISNVSTKGYELTDVERQITQLREENQKLRLSVAEFRSLSTVQKRMQALGMVPVDEVTYVAVGGSSVAAR